MFHQIIASDLHLLEFTESDGEIVTARVNKHAPAIMRSDKPVKRARNVPNFPHITRNDPRFSNLHGKLDQDKFLKSFGFLHDRQEKEARILEKKVKKTKNEDIKATLKSELSK